MNIHQAIYKELSTYPGLAALVGNRIYPLIMPQNVVLPAITYVQVSDPGIHAMMDDPNIYSPRFQISCWAGSFSDAVEVSEQVKLALKDFTGLLGGAGGVNVHKIFYENSVQLYEDETNVFQISLDFIVWYEG